MGIGIGIANTFIEYWYLIYASVNSQYFSIAHRNELVLEIGKCAYDIDVCVQ